MKRKSFLAMMLMAVMGVAMVTSCKKDEEKKAPGIAGDYTVTIKVLGLVAPGTPDPEFKDVPLTVTEAGNGKFKVNATVPNALGAGVDFTIADFELTSIQEQPSTNGQFTVTSFRIDQQDIALFGGQVPFVGDQYTELLIEHGALNGVSKAGKNGGVRNIAFYIKNAVDIPLPDGSATITYLGVRIEGNHK